MWNNMIWGQRRRHPTDLIHPLNYLDFKLRTDNSARRQGLARHRLPTEAQGTTCGPRPRTGDGRLQPPCAGRPSCWGAAPWPCPGPPALGQGPIGVYSRGPGSRVVGRARKVGSPALRRDGTGPLGTGRTGPPSFPLLWGLQRSGCRPSPRLHPPPQPADGPVSC